MPDISQDAFEALHPSDPPVLAEVLRARANSLGSRTGRRPSQQLPDDVADKLRLAADSSVIEQPEVDSFPVSTGEPGGGGGGSSKQPNRRPRTKTISEAEMESFNHKETANEHLYGYKRKSAHRYVTKS